GEEEQGDKGENANSEQELAHGCTHRTKNARCPLPMRLYLLLALALVSCRTPAAAVKPAEVAPVATKPIDQAALVAVLARKHGEAARARAERGVRQVAAFWRAEDG